MIFTKRILSRLGNSVVNLSRKPGLDLSCDLLQHLQGVLCTYLLLGNFPVFVVFTLLLSYAEFCSFHHSHCLSHEKQPDLILVLYGWQFLLNLVFVLFCFIMHILPLPLCGLCSISAQNSYGPKSSL